MSLNGANVSIEFHGRTYNAMVLLASDNLRSLLLAIEEEGSFAISENTTIGMMAILGDVESGEYIDVVTGAPVKLIFVSAGLRKVTQDGSNGTFDS